MRIAPHPLSAYPRYLRPIFWLQRRLYGQVLQPGLLWGRFPGLLLGVTIVGAHAGDLLAEFVLAMKHGLGLNEFLDTIHTYAI